MAGSYTTVKLTREELYERIWETPASELAKQFHISDVALGKLCQRMNVPKPPRGYWERVRAGESIQRPPLPKNNDSTRDLIFLKIPKTVEVRSETQAVIDELLSDERVIKLAGDLDKLHPLVERARIQLERASPTSEGLLSLPKGKGFVSLIASTAQSTRALLVLDALFRELENRGYAVVVSSDHWGEETRIVKEGESVSISIYEKAREVKRELTDEQKKKPPYLVNLPAQFETNGKLHVKINEVYGEYRRISDRQRVPVEDRLGEILREVIGLLENRVAKKRKREQEEQQRQEAIRQREDERKRRQHLERDALAWHTSEEIRRYLDAFETRLRNIDESAPEYEELIRWLTWARNYVDSIDPLNEFFPLKESDV